MGTLDSSQHIFDARQLGQLATSSFHKHATTILPKPNNPIPNSSSSFRFSKTWVTLSVRIVKLEPQETHVLCMSAVPSEDLGDTAMALQQVRQRMAAACQAAGRAPEKVRRVS
jgi:hypothetical protein